MAASRRAFSWRHRLGSPSSPDGSAPVTETDIFAAPLSPGRPSRYVRSTVTATSAPGCGDGEALAGWAPRPGQSSAWRLTETTGGAEPSAPSEHDGCIDEGADARRGLGCAERDGELHLLSKVRERAEHDLRHVPI